MNVPVVSHLKLLVNLYNKMNNRFLVLLVIYLIIYLLSVLYKNKQIFCAILLSLLSWERGLKYTKLIIANEHSVAPLVGAWIEIAWLMASEACKSSLLSWERGLKFMGLLWCDMLVLSLLSWERGLKCRVSCIICTGGRVAPLVGAWIEISAKLMISSDFSSLLSWERGLK